MTRTYLVMDAFENPHLPDHITPTTANAVNLLVQTVETDPDSGGFTIDTSPVGAYSPDRLNALVASLPLLATAVERLDVSVDPGHVALPPSAVLRVSERFPPATVSDHTLFAAWVDDEKGFDADIPLPDDPVIRAGAHHLAMAAMRWIARVGDGLRDDLKPGGRDIIDRFHEAME